jgi:hypothetical protein
MIDSSSSEFFNATDATNDILTAAVRRYYSVMFGERLTGTDSTTTAANRHALDALFKKGILSDDAHRDAVLRLQADDTPSTEPTRRGFGAKISAEEHLQYASASAGTITGCDIEMAGDSAVKTLETDESYTLMVAAPTITIKAATVFGAM